MDMQVTIQGIAGWLWDCLTSAVGQIVTGGIVAGLVLLWCLVRSPFRAWQVRRSFDETSRLVLGLLGFGITLENRSRVPVKVLRVALTADDTHFILNYSGRKDLMQRKRVLLPNGRTDWLSESIRSFDASETEGGVDLAPGMSATWYLPDDCPLEPGNDPLAGHVILQYQPLFGSRRDIEVEFKDRDRITRAFQAHRERRQEGLAAEKFSEVAELRSDCGVPVDADRAVPNSTDPAEFHARILSRKAELESRLTAAAERTDAEHAFLTFTLLQVIKISKAGGLMDEYEHGSLPAEIETAAFYLYPHFGKCAQIDPAAIQEIVDAIPEMHRVNLLHAGSEAFGSGRAVNVIGASRLHAQSVRGSAWPDQTKAEIIGIQGLFDQWFERTVGISPSRAIAIIEAMEQTFSKLLEGAQEQIFKQSGNPPESSECAKDVAAFLESIVSAMVEELPRRMPMERVEVQITPEITEVEWNALLGMIGLTPARRAEMAEPPEVSQRPMFVIGEARAFLVDESTALDALYDAFDAVARTDERFYSGKFSDHRSDWVEERTMEFLGRVFPQTALFRNLVYPDPDKSNGEAELDGLVLWGPFEIFIEAKAKQFRFCGRLQNPSHLRTDLERNIHDAFEQASRALRYIDLSAAPTFKERSSGRIAKIRRGNLCRRHVISVSLHHLGPVAAQLAVLKEVGLFSQGRYPWTVCLADLDIVTRFAATPDVLVHYLKRRIEMQESGKPLHGDELDLFGQYLDTRLHPSLYWRRKTDKGEDFDFLHIAGGHERFQMWKEVDLGLRIEAPEVRLNVPSAISKILNELRRRDDDATRFLAVSLLDFHPEDLDHLASVFEQQSNVEFTPDHFPRITYKNAHDDTVITVVAGKSVNPETIQERTKMRSLIEKYRHRSAKAMGFSINRSDPDRPFDLALFYEYPWAHDEKLENLIKQDVQRLLPGARVPSEDAPCPCGSGKTFEDCCGPRIERA